MIRNYIVEKNKIYFPDKKGNILAEINFEKIDNKTYNIFHTFVDDSLRGQGIGSELVEKAINHLTSKGYQVLATCSYAKKLLNK